MTDRLQLEVAYARPERQLIVKLSLPAGTTAREAVLQSGIASEFADIDPAQLKLGIFGKAVPAEHVLRDRDRVEIYRPLQADPKEVRRRRAEAGKAE
ncbi:RnfH [Vogesella sp. EB]|uniref:RnfH family protein n=1 Tax=Vogesella sp. EB TaxID=1526735 RepID=UPI00064D5873|nr:RnfH family protein [Vogesella sp. EB]KMJ54674.1 RnfH [Vogesella sp. EB]